MNFCPSCSIGISVYEMRNRKCSNCLHEWEIYHVMPLNDLKEHFESYQCHCQPKINNEGDNMVCVHNSFDGREGVEQFYDILNKKDDC